MSFYSSLKRWKKEERARVADNLLALRRSLQGQVPRGFVWR